MIYLRNNTKQDQWLEDPVTGVRRKIEAEELARVTAATADHALLNAPTTWVRVIPIPLEAVEREPPG